MAINRVITETPDPRNVVQSLFGLSVNELAREIRENKKGKYAALYKRCEAEIVFGLINTERQDK